MKVSAYESGNSRRWTGDSIAEETHLRPKPMIEIGGKPILWHIMKMYGHHGISDFIICCGFKGYLIKEYFANCFLHMSDVTFDMSANEMQIHRRFAEPWKVTLVDTGESTMTGGRLRRVKKYVEDETAFCFTYGDGVSDVDISALIAFHQKHGKLAKDYKRVMVCLDSNHAHAQFWRN